MKKLVVICLLLLLSGFAFSEHPGSQQIVNKVVITYRDTQKLNFVNVPSLYHEGWDTLAQSRFWKDIISMSSDSFVINVASCRTPLDKVSRSIWMNQSEPDKTKYKDSLSCAYNVAEGAGLFVTSGKREFYELKKVLPEISKAIRVFEQNDCDPFYAQTILLIESPGKYRSKSSVGANGPFQLMRSVARKYGLRVTKTHDDRSDLEKSARAAARLINNACIPYVKSYLNERSIEFNETDLWFRLLVMHVYHAGAGNVHCVINELNPSKGGVDLFRQIWQTTCGRFKNESQNYSQIALASLVTFDDIVNQDGDTVFLVQGDKFMKAYNRKSYNPLQAFDYLNKCLSSYENDLVVGTIPFDHFLKKIGVVRKEFLFIATHIKELGKDIDLNPYPASESHVDNFATALLRHQRYDEAIRLLKLNIDMHPTSITAYDRLSNAYMVSGDKKMAALYNNRSATLSKKELLKGTQ